MKPKIGFIDYNLNVQLGRCPDDIEQQVTHIYYVKYFEELKVIFKGTTLWETIIEFFSPIN